MQERIKQWAIFILTPVAFIAGWLFYLLTKNARLENDLRREQADKQLAGTLSKMDLAKKEAEDAEERFRSDARDLARAIDEFEGGDAPESSS